jgi:PAS domain S-box-containing protein
VLIVFYLSPGHLVHLGGAGLILVLVTVFLVKQRRQEAALRRSEATYRGLVENAVEGIYQSTPDGRLLLANRALAGMLGYPCPEELVASCPDISQSYVEPQHREEMKRQMEQAGVVRDFEVQLYRKDHSTVWAALYSCAVCNRAGKVLYYEGAFVDISERKQLEERVQRAQKMGAVGQLASGLAHDFINLLTAVSGWSQLISANLPDNHEALESVRELFAAIDSAASVSRQLMSLGRQPGQPGQSVNLSTLVSGLEKMLRYFVGKEVELETVLDSGLAPVAADPGHLEQILLNLVINARDAMPEGGRLCIETRNVDRGSRGRYVLLSVRDSGCGMSDEIKARLFEPFFSTKEQGKGTGLGLTLVDEMVKQSGGHIEVHSDLGQGSTFLVYLPSSEARAGPTRGAPWPRPMDNRAFDWSCADSGNATVEILTCY